jgi:hypothetical protein
MVQPSPGSILAGQPVPDHKLFTPGVISICIVATLIGAYEAWLAVDQPLLGSDAGFRVFNSHLPVAKMGNRIWLPYLQVHIWMYRLLGLPYAGLKLITVFYSTLGTLCVGLYWRRILGSGASATALSIIAVVCFAANSLVIATRDLMQESVGVGLLFAFLLVASTGRALSVAGLALGTAALLTRDSYWIYLLAATLIGPRQSPWNWPSVRSCALLWSVPVLWLGALLVGR